MIYNSTQAPSLIEAISVFSPHQLPLARGPPAAARVARGLASGKTVEDIATDGGTSANPIRTQVRGVLEKTGCNRQVEIVALLTAISSTRLTHPI